MDVVVGATEALVHPQGTITGTLFVVSGKKSILDIRELTIGIATDTSGAGHRTA